MNICKYPSYEIVVPCPKNGQNLNIYKKIKAVSKNYFRIDRWILIERNVDEKIKDVNASIPLQVDYDHFDKTVEYIRKTFYDEDLDEGEKKEIKFAKKYGHFFPNIVHGWKIIGMHKVGSGKVYVRSLRKVSEFSGNTLLTYAFYTDPEYRKKGVASYLMTYTLKIVRNKGFKYVRGQIRPENVASLRLHGKCGFYEIARFWHIRFLWWDFATLDMGKAKTRKRVPLILSK